MNLQKSKKMQLTVLSADKTIYSESVTLVRFPGIDGSFTVLNNHAPMLARLKKGNLVVVPENSSTKESVPIQGGLVRVLDNQILVLTGI
jgi:F-type H+-transporting ATPase subunit epsilon